MNYIYAAIVAALVAFAGAWKVQDWRYEGQINDIKLEMSEAAQKAFDIAQADYERQIKQKDEALNEANKRAQRNAALAASARGDVDSLRDQLASARNQLSTATAEAARDYAATLSDVFGECVSEYQELAAKADGHASDAKTLSDGWPSP